MRVALFMYDCQPRAGSEPGIGWQFANMVGADHEVVAFTREVNRPAIEAAWSPPSITWEYVPLRSQVGPFRFRRNIPHALHGMAWLRLAVARAAELHRVHAFDLSHFVTFTAFWLPTPFWKLDMPHVHGPLTGGEANHRAFQRIPGAAALQRAGRSMLFTSLMRTRDWQRSMVRPDTLTVCATQTVANLVAKAGAARVNVFRPPFSATKDLAADLEGLRSETPVEPGLVVMSGRQVPWKGHDLGLRAFAAVAADWPGLRLCVIGDGPERRRLWSLARTLGIASQVEFVRHLHRDAERQRIAASEVFLFPSRRDAGATLVPISLLLGTRFVGFSLAPTQVAVGNVGFLARPEGPAGPVGELADALRRALATDRNAGLAARVDRGRHLLDIEDAAARMGDWYAEVVNARNGVEV
ncbi:MAG: glycosyltransferase family 4 protein [Actinomycetota bacterium]